MRKGIIGVYIHSMNDPYTGRDLKGLNPLGRITTITKGRTVTLSSLYPTYDWINDNGYSNLSNWVESAALAVGR